MRRRASQSRSTVDDIGQRRDDERQERRQWTSWFSGTATMDVVVFLRLGHDHVDDAACNRMASIAIAIDGRRRRTATMDVVVFVPPPPAPPAHDDNDVVDASSAPRNAPNLPPIGATYLVIILSVRFMDSNKGCGWGDVLSASLGG